MLNNARFYWLGLIGLLLSMNLNASLPMLSQTSDLPSLAPMIERVSPAVVNISVSGSVTVNAPYNPFGNDPFFERFFGTPNNTPQNRQREFQSAGSGVIIDAAQGYILTNHHVIENAENITVTLLDERALEATVVGSDKDTDIAVIKVDAKNLQDIPLGNSDTLRVGDFVVAIGNPFGFRHTVTSGIVSALGRSGLNQESYEDFIQTDASINPGNSGGALINLNGELVGINSAIISRSGGNLGIGFAIPINMASSVKTQLVDFGEVKRGLLGVRILSLTPQLAEAYGLKTKKGALIAAVDAGSAAEKAGLKALDVVTAVDNKKIDSALELRNTLGLKRTGQKIALTYIRDGKKYSAITTLSGEQTSIADITKDLHKGLIGAEFGETADNQTKGVLVAEVAAGSPAARRGLIVGDVITEVNRKRVKNLDDFKAALNQKGHLGLTIERGSRQLLLPIM